MKSVNEVLSRVAKDSSSKIDEILTLEKYFEFVRENPKKYLRCIKQIVSDGIVSAVKKEVDNDPESINFNQIDCSKIFDTFMPDTLFANRFIQKIEGMKIGATQNKIYIFRGPPGCGKSTFMDDLLKFITEYTNSPEGKTYEIVWRIPKKEKDVCAGDDNGKDYSEIHCPSHDHPIMIIPIEHRAEFLDGLLENNEDKHEIANNKEYEWIFSYKPCAICESFFHELSKKFGSVEEVFKRINVRENKFNRRVGNGITVFGPGDEPIKQFTLDNEPLQKIITDFFEDSNKVQYTYSPFAKTNNGIYVLTDIKDNNVQRMRKLHNIVSEALLKVGHKEESVNSLLLVIMNLEDWESISDLKSFADRVEYLDVTYVTEVPVEIKILEKAFGHDIGRHFLPRVLKNFVKMIVSTRLDQDSKAIKTWLGDIGKYKKYTDGNGLLIKMDLYRGKIPSWLSEEDRKKLTADTRRMIMKEAEKDGHFGLSGRDSIKLFKELMNKHRGSKKLITMEDIDFFFAELQRKKTELANSIKDKEEKERALRAIPKKEFFISLLSMYNYTTTEEIKMALYEFNEEQINKDIMNYLYAINMEIDTEEVCPWTREKIKASEDFFDIIEKKLFEKKDEKIRRAIQKKYVQKTLQEINIEEKSIGEADLFLSLKNNYISKLKDTSITSLKDSENFRNAIANFNDTKFETYDQKIKYSVKLLIKNLQEKYGYTEEGAISVSLYALDNELFNA